MTITKKSLLAGIIGLAAMLVSPLARAETDTLRIGVQKYGTLVIMTERHSLEARLKSQGITVEWKEFASGPPLLEALNVGSIDFGTTGESPPVFAQAAGTPLVYVGVEPGAPSGEAILVPKDSPLTRVADLKGKRVALTKGANVHFLLVQALASAGLEPKDITPVYLAPSDGRAAFESGSVDAWVIWDPYLAAAQQATNARQLINGVGLTHNRQFYLASRQFAESNPALLASLLDEINKTDHWAAEHKSEVATLLAARTGIPVSAMEISVGRLGIGAAPMDNGVIQDQQAIADAFFRLGLIPQALTVSSVIWAPHS